MAIQGIIVLLGWLTLVKGTTVTTSATTVRKVCENTTYTHPGYTCTLLKKIKSLIENVTLQTPLNLYLT